ncbi:MAG: hypothetical protein PHX87_02240 [Candidatus Peribacteraceae bacterium]|nr:hypothetical protein [Candidatus Peribacteraceae bacterium]MDD5742226.1 hypothetical protein [Candidatus Peribacteraceae bacterium]
MNIDISQEPTRFGTLPVDELKRGMPQKVIVIRTSSGEEIAHVFPMHIQHIDEVRKILSSGGTLVAAGAVDTGMAVSDGGPFVGWDSNTCREAPEIGHDQPVNPAESQRVAAEVAEKVR